MIEAATIDRKCCAGKEINPGIWGIGDLWVTDRGEIRTLADVHGALCVIQVRLKPLPSTVGEK